jgi:hypothetical protein
VLAPHLSNHPRKQKRDDATGAPSREKQIPSRRSAIGLTAGELTALSAAATTATASTFRGTAIFARTGFIDSQSATADFLAGQGSNGSLGAFGRAHGDKAKTAGTTAHAIGDEVDFGDRPVSCEKILQIIFGGVKGKIPDIQFRIHF